MKGQELQTPIKDAHTLSQILNKVQDMDQLWFHSLKKFYNQMYFLLGKLDQYESSNWFQSNNDTKETVESKPRKRTEKGIYFYLNYWIKKELKAYIAHLDSKLWFQIQNRLSL